MCGLPLTAQQHQLQKEQPCWSCDERTVRKGSDEGQTARQARLLRTPSLHLWTPTGEGKNNRLFHCLRTHVLWNDPEKNLNISIIILLTYFVPT